MLIQVNGITNHLAKYVASNNISVIDAAVSSSEYKKIIVFLPNEPHVIII